MCGENVLPLLSVLTLICVVSASLASLLHSMPYAYIFYILRLTFLDFCFTQLRLSLRSSRNFSLSHFSFSSCYFPQPFLQPLLSSIPSPPWHSSLHPRHHNSTITPFITVPPSPHHQHRAPLRGSQPVPFQ